MKKNSKTIAVTLFSFMCLIMFSGIAHSADFTFHVPVELNNISSSYVKGMVFCEILDAVNHGMAVSSSKEFILVGGNFNGTAEVALSMPTGQDRAAAKGWQCEVNLFSTNGAQWPLVKIPDIDTTKPLKTFVNGKLP
jgi:hypothetical protein